MSRCDDSLWDHIERGDSGCADPGHAEALRRRREEGGVKWSPIVRGRDAGGDRDFLDGRPIHCGTTLELQATEDRSDDYGSYTVYLDRGQPVRYELAFRRTEEGRPEKQIDLYVYVAGANFVAPHNLWMRFRWPRRAA